MLPLRLGLVGLIVGSLGLVGCQGDGGNPAGPEAGENRTYTAEDATAAQPQRGPAENADEGS